MFAKSRLDTIGLLANQGWELNIVLVTTDCDDYLLIHSFILIQSDPIKWTNRRLKTTIMVVSRHVFLRWVKRFTSQHPPIRDWQMGLVVVNCYHRKSPAVQPTYSYFRCFETCLSLMREAFHRSRSDRWYLWSSCNPNLIGIVTSPQFLQKNVDESCLRIEILLLTVTIQARIQIVVSVSTNSGTSRPPPVSYLVLRGHRA